MAPVTGLEQRIYQIEDALRRGMSFDVSQFSADVVLGSLDAGLRNLWKKINLMQQATATPFPHVKWLMFGDSMATDMARYYGPSLYQTMGGQAGAYFSMATELSGVTINSTTGTVTNNTADFDAMPGGLTEGYATGATRTYGVLGGNFICDQVKVYYVKGPASSKDGGNFKIQVDGVDTSFTNVSTVAAGLSLGVATVTPTLGPHNVTVVCLTGPIRIVGVGFENTSIRGIVPISPGQGGIALASALPTAWANFSTFLADVLPDVMTLEVKDASSTYGAALDSCFNAARAGNPNMDVIGLASGPVQTNDADQVLQNTILRKACQANRYIYWDGYTPLVNWNTVNSLGWGTDTVHLDTPAWKYKAALFMRDLGLTQQLGQTLPNTTGTVPVFNVKDPAYGASGLGVADDTAAIKAAINAAAPTGGTVYLPPGTYLVSGSGFSAIDPKSNISIVGAGRTATIIKLAAASNRIVIANTVGVSDLTISDLTIDGNKANQTTGGNGIEIGSSSRVTITRVRVINAYARGINVTATTDSLVAFNEVESNGPGATTVGALELRSGSNNCRVIGNRVLNPSGHGIEVGALGVTGCDVIGNIVVNPQNSGGIGIALAGSQYVNCNGNYVTSTLTDGNCIDQGNATDTVIANNTVQGGGAGIDADSGARVAFVGNVCSNNHNVGISMEFSNLGATTAFDAVVTGNMVSGAGDSGIALDGVTNGIVSGNVVKNSSKITAGKGGISIRSTLRAATGIAIQGNRCYDDQGTKTQAYGIQSTGTCDFLTITNNDIRGNLTGAMSLVGSNNAVGDNTGYRIHGVKILAYSATIATDASLGDIFPIVATNGTAFTISTPTNPQTDMLVTYDIKNSSGGALGAITWGAAFLLAGAFTNPANGKRRTISFYYDGTNWVETNRAAADI